MSGQDDHPHVQTVPFTPFQQQQQSTPPSRDDSGPIPIDIDDEVATTAVTTSLPSSATTAAIMPTFDELQGLAAAQAEQLEQASDMIQQQQQQMVDAQAAFDAQQQQLRESADRMRQQQQTIDQLASAFTTLTTATSSSTGSSHRRKPDMPPFDQQNILIWIKRLTAAYDRAGVVLPKDKFAFLESTFDITFNPVINNFLFNSNNTAEDWDNFIQYMKTEYGPTIRQKARKLIGDLPRNGMKPSQYLAQLEEEVKDVKLDDIKKEHLLKTIPPRIREILGKTVETKTAKEVAALADDYFDSQGRPLEKSATSINYVSSQQSTATPAPQQSFTAAYSDEETEVNQVKKGNFKNFRQRSRSRPRFGSNNRSSNSFTPSSSSSTTAASTSSSRQQHNNSNSSGLCRFHRLFGDNATKCMSDCSRHSSFMSSQKKQQGNGQGGRRQ